MNQKLFFSCLVYIFLTNCNSSEKKTNAIAEAEKTISHETLQVPVDFSNIDASYSTLIKAINEHNDIIFDQLISKTGLFIIATKEEHCVIKKHYHINEFQLNGKTIFETNKVRLSKKFKKGELPIKDCSKKNPFNKKGAFGKGINLLLHSGFPKNCISEEFSTSMLIKAVAIITYTVVNTDFGVFYFNKENNQWKLVFLDIRKPCDY